MKGISIKDKGLKIEISKASEFDKLSLEVGVFEGEISKIATVHEYGSPSNNIPSRPFFGPSFDNNKNDYIKKMMESFHLSRSYKHSKSLLAILGIRLQKDIREKLKNGPHAPLKESTIKAKGSSRPLVDTGTMMRSIAFEVKG